MKRMQEYKYMELQIVITFSKTSQTQKKKIPAFSSLVKSRLKYKESTRELFGQKKGLAGGEAGDELYQIFYMWRALR